MIHYFYAMAGAIPAARSALEAAAAAMGETLAAEGTIPGETPTPATGQM